jgi:hypothetical protein
MTTQIEEKTEFKFGELGESAKQHAIEKWQEGGIDYDWWDSTYEDAAQVGLTINEFDTQYRPWAKGEISNMTYEQSARLVMETHGKDCDTHKAALAFMCHVALMDEGAKHDEDGEQTEAFAELCETYLKSILDAYARMLKDDLEYLESEQAAVMSIKANDYDFDEDGNMI